jgi:DNA-binding NtrC family response regulator
VIWPATTNTASVISALVVDPETSDRVFAGSALAAAGFHVTVSDTFASAKDRMAARPPRVLVTEVCLAEDNGIHLVIRGAARGHKLAAVVTCDHEDPVLRETTEKLGGTFLVKPVATKDLVAAVMRTLFRPEGDGTPIRAPFERRVADRRTHASTPRDVERRRQRERRRGLDALRAVQPN